MKKIISLIVLAVASFAAVAAGSSGPAVEEKPLVFDTINAALLVAGRMATDTASKFGFVPASLTACGVDHNIIVVRAASIGNEAFATISQPPGTQVFVVERGAKRTATVGECMALDNEARLNELRGKS